MIQPSSELGEFIGYFWLFHGPGGTFEIENITIGQAAEACRLMSLEPDFAGCGIDTLDRNGACEIALKKFGLKNPYENRQ